MLAYNVYNYNLKAPAVTIPLKGILVGNGCVELELCMAVRCTPRARALCRPPLTRTAPPHFPCA